MKTNWKQVLLLVSLLPGTLSTISVAHATPSCSLPAYRDGYEVTSKSALEVLGTDVDCRGMNIYQTNDIELDGWNTPILSWYGTFDGGGSLFTDVDGIPLRLSSLILVVQSPSPILIAPVRSAGPPTLVHSSSSPQVKMSGLPTRRWMVK